MGSGHDQDQVLPAHRDGRQPELRRRLGAEYQVEAVFQQPLQKLLRNAGIECKADVFIWVCRQKAGGQTRHKLYTQCTKQPQTDQTFAAGHALQGIHTFI